MRLLLVNLIEEALGSAKCPRSVAQSRASTRRDARRTSSRLAAHSPCLTRSLETRARNGRPGTPRRAATEANHFARSLCEPLAAVSVETRSAIVARKSALPAAFAANAARRLTRSAFGVEHPVATFDENSRARNERRRTCGVAPLLLVVASSSSSSHHSAYAANLASRLTNPKDIFSDEALSAPGSRLIVALSLHSLNELE